MSKAFLIDHFTPATMLTDGRLRIADETLQDDPRPALILAEMEGAARRRGQWRRVFSPVGDAVDRLLLAARSVA